MVVVHISAGSCGARVCALPALILSKLILSYFFLSWGQVIIFPRSKFSLVFQRLQVAFLFFCCQFCLHMPRLIARICMGRYYVGRHYIIMLSCGGAIILIVVLVAQMSCDIYGRTSCDIGDVWIRPFPSSSRLVPSSSRLVSSSSRLVSVRGEAAATIIFFLHTKLLVCFL